MSGHERVAVELRRRIMTGAYPRGSRLPPVWRIGDEFGVTEPVASRAVAELKRAGLLRSVPGVGVWVVDEITDAARMQTALDAARAGEYLPDMWNADAKVYDGESSEPEIVEFPAPWIQRLLDERAALTLRLADAERDATMSGTRSS